MISDELVAMTEQHRGEFDELATVLDGVPSEFPLLDLDGQGDLVLALDGLRKELKDALSRVNRSRDACQRDFAIAIVHAEQVPYRNEKATFSPSVRGYFDVVNPRALVAWLRVNEPGVDPYERLTELISKVEPIRALCERRLEEGENLPPGIKGHSVASVKVTRKRGGDAGATDTEF